MFLTLLKSDLMGLFSTIAQKKQKEAGGDYRSRAERASKIGEAEMRRFEEGAGATVGPKSQQKRARQRLIGAIALSLTAAVVLPTMALSDKAGPFRGDIRMRAAAKEPVRQHPKELVDINDTLDRGESIVASPKAISASHNNSVSRSQFQKNGIAIEPRAPHEQVRTGMDAVAKSSNVTPKKSMELAPVTAAVKSKAAFQREGGSIRDASKTEKIPSKHEARESNSVRGMRLPKYEIAGTARTADAAAIYTERIAAKPAARVSIEPTHPSSREPAVDIGLGLATRHAESGTAPAKRTFVVQAAALADNGKALELQGRLREEGIPYFTERLTKKSGELIRIRVGPLTKGEKERVRAKLIMLGLSPSDVTTP